MNQDAVVCDLRVVQEPSLRGRPEARFAYELAVAVERARPDCISCYLLDRSLPPPGAADELAATGKLLYRDDPRARERIALSRVCLSLAPPTGARGLDAVRPAEVDRYRMRFATVLHETESILAAPTASLLARRHAAFAREVARSADVVLLSSDAIRASVEEALGEVAPPCEPVGTGVAHRFVVPRSRHESLEQLRRHLPGLDGPFVLCSGEADPAGLRGIVGAVEGIPRLAGRSLQLVVFGDVPPEVREELRHGDEAAERSGLLVFPGLVSEEWRVLLYQATDLYVVLGGDAYILDALEALAAGAVVAVPDSPSFAEVIPFPRARFPSSREESPSGAVTRCLSDAALREEIGGCVRHHDWRQVAERVAAILERLSSRPLSRPKRPRERPRVAVLSPLPPMRSGVADYSARLLEALHALLGAGAASPIVVDCFVDGRDRYPVTAEPVAGLKPVDARLFPLADAVVDYDAVVYVLGNSEYHSNALAALRRRRGIVFTHDVRLSGLFTFASDTKGAVDGGLSATITRSYAGLPEGLGGVGSITPGEQDRHGLLLLREVARHADRILVTSEPALRLAALDLGPDLAARLGILPFAAYCLLPEERALVTTARETRQAPPPFRIASFGIVDPAKRPEVLVLALCELVERGIDAELVLVGLVSDALSAELRTLAADLAVASRLRVTGPVDRDGYLTELATAHLAVQLRSRFYGEASAAVSECLSAGLPTVVSRLGWMTEIPDEAVWKVAPDCTPNELAGELAALIRDAEARRSLSLRGEAWVRDKTFSAAASALLAELRAAISAS